jgi:hypothetical protein
VNELIETECKLGPVNTLELKGGALICTEVELIMVICIGAPQPARGMMKNTVSEPEKVHEFEEVGKLRTELRITIRQIQLVELIEVLPASFSLKLKYMSYAQG